MSTQATASYQFGPFEVHVPSGELRKDGRPVRLQHQPFRLLVVLLENSGQVVTREDLQARLWDGNTFVDFDASLRVAVRKLREVLGDDADDPRYIETVPKRGYRFLGPAVQTSASSVDKPQLQALVTPPAIAPAPRRNRSLWMIGLISAAAISAAGYLLLSHRTPIRTLTDRDTVVIAEFSNSTGDPVFDETLRQGLSIQLEQSPFLSLISEERIQRSLTMMGRSADARLTPDLAREVCERTGSAAVLEGSIAKLGTQYVLGLRATSCRTSDLLDEEQVQTASKEDVLNALGQIASKFRRRVGESLTSVEEHNTPLAEATTPSLEALKAYSAAWKVHAASGSSAAMPLFQRAIAIDPNFALAHAALGLVYSDTGESALSAESVTRAYALREHTSEREKFLVSTFYDVFATGNMEKARETCELWARTYPRDMMPHANLAGVIYPVLGKYEQAADQAKQAIALDPDSETGYALLAYSDLYLNRLPDAEHTLQQAADRKLDAHHFSILRYDIAFLKHDQAAMDREVALTQSNSATEDWIADHQAFAFAYRGQLRKARADALHAAEIAEQVGHRERGALFRTGPALWEAFFGNPVQAKWLAAEVLALPHDREVEYGAAVALALVRDQRAGALADDLQRKFPDDTSVRFSYLPTLRAIDALNRGEPDKAIRELEVSLPYELGAPRCSMHGIFGPMYPVYVRGLAYLAAHEGVKAAAEFQKIAEHPGLVVSDPIGALANLHLARAYLQAGDKIKAKAAYDQFHADWSAADSDLVAAGQFLGFSSIR